MDLKPREIELAPRRNVKAGADISSSSEEAFALGQEMGRLLAMLPTPRKKRHWELFEAGLKSALDREPEERSRFPRTLSTQARA